MNKQLEENIKKAEQRPETVPGQCNWSFHQRRGLFERLGPDF